jgi:hypothetical protein
MARAHATFDATRRKTELQQRRARYVPVRTRRLRNLELDRLERAAVDFARIPTTIDGHSASFVLEPAGAPIPPPIGTEL